MLFTMGGVGGGASGHVTSASEEVPAAEWETAFILKSTVDILKTVSFYLLHF